MLSVANGWQMLANTILADTLSALIGLSSVAFYIAAFFYPEVHRRSDVVWSGLGMFYALILWLCAGQMTLAALLGQVAVVALVLGLGWQTLTIRRQKTPVYQQTPVVITPEVVGNWAKNKVNALRIAPADPVPLKLEKRSLSEFPEDRLGQRIDPRRRPAYEYEFVEDGILESSELEALIDPQLTLDLTAEEVPDVKAEYSAPPSAIAEIISVESEAIETSSEPPEQSETSEADIEVLDVIKEASSEPAADSLETFEEIKAELKPAELKPADLDPTELDPAELDSTATKETDSDWDDDIFDEAPVDVAESDPTVQISTAQSVQPKPPNNLVESKKKPNLLAIPLILVGWIKDLASSFTKPKPSKPVIEIPRREPTAKATEPPSEPATAANPPLAPPDNNDEFNDREESNWDD